MSSYNSTLSSPFDKHAPPPLKKVISRQRVTWFNSDIKEAIRARRRAERKWRNTNSQQHLRAFKVARNHTAYLMNSARRDYFSNLIAENSSNQRKLFHTTNSLPFEPTDVSFPDHIPPDDLANNFGNYLVQKIELTMTHWTPLGHLSLLSAIAMRPQITWAHAQTVLVLIWANV